jgi:ParB/RepB/Spo0J family partition protein
MEHIPLKKLVLSAQNVRTNVEDATDIAGLVASIEAHGLLSPLIVTKGKKPEVVAGGRRYRALCKLAEEGKLPDDYEVPVRVVDPAEAVEVSLVENFIRKDMRPYEIYRAFAALPGLSDEQLAQRFGMPLDKVRRVLRLGNLLPEIFEAYTTGQLDDAEAKAFAATADHGVQAEAWAAYQRLEDYNRGVWQVRKLVGQASRDDELLLELVGRERYEAEGGKIEADLFSDKVRINDRELLERLASVVQRETLEAWAARANRAVTILDAEPAGLAWNSRAGWEYGELADAAQAARLAELLELEQTTDEQEDELDALLALRPVVFEDTERPVGCYYKWGRITCDYLDAVHTVATVTEGETPPEPEAPAASKSATERMAVMRTYRLTERTEADLTVKADAYQLLTFIVHRACFMGPRDYDLRGFSTVAPSPWDGERWMQEADYAEAWKAFQEFGQAQEVAARMIGHFTTAKHGLEKAPLMEWIASLSAPQRWQSCPEFWTMFNKKQIFRMLGEVIPSLEAIHSNTKLSEVRSIAHRICAGEIDPKISPMEADQLVAAQAWVPQWLRFNDEQPQ